MSCLEHQELISGYLDDELSKGEVKKLLTHLEDCSKCKADLSFLVRQKEKVHSLRSVFSGPAPSPGFSQKVMDEINQSPLFPETKKSVSNFSDFVNWLLFPIKKPAYAGLFSVLILVGILTGFFVGEYIPGQGDTELMSVYELQAKTSLPDTLQPVNIEEGEEEKNIVFHHVASSSMGTLAPEPGLLKYTAYTSDSEH